MGFHRFTSVRIFSQNVNLTASVFFVITFACLLLFSTRAAQQTGDSLVYAFSANTGQEIFHPHHLLYTPAMRLFSLALSPLCESCDVIFAGQIHNILWAVVGVLSFFFILKQLMGTTFLSLLAAILLLVTRGFWELSTQTTMYVPAASILTLLVAVLLIDHNSYPYFTIRRMSVISLLFALAVLYHQANVLFSLPLSFYLVVSKGKRGWKESFVIISFTGIIVLSVYIAIFLSINNIWSVQEFIRFCLSYTTEICFGGQCKDSPNHWGTVANLSGTGFQALGESLLWNLIIAPKSLISIITPVFALSLLSLCLWHIRQLAKHAIHAKVRAFLLIWMLTYILFFFWWLPSYQHPFVITLIPILLLVFLAVKDFVGKSKVSNFNPMMVTTALIVVIILITARNFYLSILPLQNLESDTYLESSELSVLVPPECVILTNTRVWSNLTYYFDRGERTIELKNPLNYFYRDKPLPQQYQLDDEICVFVLASYVTPGFTLLDYKASGSNAYSDPSEWLAYMAWLFNFEYSSNHTLVASRKFEVVTLDQGGPYIFLSPSKIEVEGFQDLFQRLDKQLGGTLDEEADPFQTWFASAYLNHQGDCGASTC